ncbi:MAG: hypothetical protein K8823_383 [Cenarchaeum symbiont of Oopsacas minuta]|nr:hypothetical protein [Cenarchaeum symbiont of Oopsacas minuta]
MIYIITWFDADMDVFTRYNNKLSKFQHQPNNFEIDLEDFLEKNPSILEDNLKIIGRQVNATPHGKIDLLGLDSQNNLVIIEIKKNTAKYDAVAQAINYHLWACKLKITDLIHIKGKSKLKIPKKLTEDIRNTIDGKDVNFNEYPRLYVVAEHLHENAITYAEKMKTTDIDIDCVEINFYDNKKIILVNKIFSTPTFFDDDISKYHNIDKSVLDLVNTIKKYVNNWSDVTIHHTKNYIAFKHNKRNFLALHLRQHKLIAHIIKKNIDDPKKFLKPHNKNKFNGRIWEMPVDKASMKYLKNLIKQAYENIHN